MRSLRFTAVAALGCAAATVALSGCGGDRSATSTATTPAAAPTRPATPTPTLVANDRPARRGERATVQPLMQADGVLQVAAGEGLVAVTVGDASGSRLMVGRATLEGPLELEPAEGAGTIPYWASIHVGRGDDGEPLVSYPRCSSSAFASCVPTTWSAKTRRESRVEGFDEAGGTTEVAVDRGNAAVIATRDASATLDDLITSSGPVMRAWATEGAQQARRLDLEAPLTIALHGDTLATVSDTAADAGVCGEQLAQLWRIDEPAAAPREVGTVICGLGGSRISSASLDADQARFVVANNGEDGYAETLTFDGRTGKTTRARLGAEVADLAWLSSTVGVTTGPPGFTCADALIDTSTDPDPGVGPCELDRITVRSGATSGQGSKGSR